MYRAFSDVEGNLMKSLEETYNQSIRASQNIVEDIRFSRKLYLESVDLCSMQICNFKKHDKSILMLLNNVKSANPYLHSHPVNVAFLSLVIGVWLGLSDNKLLNLVKAGFLHDIGKAKIKDSLLNKSDQLTMEEVRTLKSHPVIGYKILKGTKKYDIEVLCGVLFHHERMDETGYPVGLKGEYINLISRVIAIADTFDALTSDKAYRKKYSPLEALEEIKENCTNLDLNICDIFLKKMINYYCGREVRLSNERTGNIVSINPEKISKPLVRCDDDHCDLAESDLEIVEFF